VRAGHEPLLPVEYPAPGGRVADRGRCEGPRVGTRARLGDRIAARAFPAQARLEVALALAGVAQGEDVVHARHVGPQAAGDLSELLLDDDLLHRRPGEAAERRRQVAADQAGRDRPGAQLAALLGGELPARPLEWDL